MNQKKIIRSLATSSLVVVASLMSPPTATGDDPLPSWTNGSAKTAIIEFVEAVTQEGGKDYVAPAEHIATFDNDGTLWVEYPLYTQLLFTFDRVNKLARRIPSGRPNNPSRPSWKAI